MFVTWGEGRRFAFHVGKRLRETRLMIGKLNRLKTVDKSSTVAAINELHNRIKTMEDKATGSRRWRTRQMANKREAESMAPNDFEWTAPEMPIVPEPAIIREEFLLAITPPGDKPEFMPCITKDQARNQAKLARRLGGRVQISSRIVTMTKYAPVDESVFFAEKEKGQ